MATENNNTSSNEYSIKGNELIFFDDDYHAAIINPDCSDLDRADAIAKIISQSKTLIACIADEDTLEEDQKLAGVVWMLEDKINELSALINADRQARKALKKVQN
tara:strand:+ start:1906 stop:2220 length:315 start_codon:yes stop_codon:yes gene_type:complete